MPITILPPQTPTTTLAELLPFVLPAMPSCPDDVALFNLRWAAIEFCQKTLAWREQQGEITTLADVTEYAYEVSSDRRVTKLLSVLLDGEEVEVLPPDEGRRRDARDSDGPYVYGLLSSFEIRPAPDADLPLITYAAVMPTTLSDIIPADFERWYDVLADGAKARLFALPQTDWHNPNAAVAHRQLFLSRMASIASATQRGHAKPTRRSPHARFF
jgi:hypothetical protein